MKLALFAALGGVPGVRLFSLQKGDPGAQIKTLPPGMDIVDWTADMKDFADAAALIANLDLVISVDTAIVHLAGAMGKPVWTLLPVVAEWRLAPKTGRQPLVSIHAAVPSARKRGLE